MNIIIIQNTDPKIKPMLDVTKDHLEVIRKVVPSASVSVVNDSDIRKQSNQLLEAEIIITDDFSLIDLEKTKSLQWVHADFAGVDTLSAHLKNSSILITNSSGVHPIPIAQHVFAFILMFARGIHVSYCNQIEQKGWTRRFDLLALQELSGKTIGIVGYGRMGKEIGRVAELFGMNVLAFTHHEGDINSLLKQSDFVVNALPSTTETHHFFDKKKFAQMSAKGGSSPGRKKSAYFINIGRGATVDEKALIDVLKQKQIAGAGLDVFETEPLPKSSPLWSLENVILTPHYSGWTPYYMDRVIAIFCENLKAYASGTPMPNLVDKRKGY